MKENGCTLCSKLMHHCTWIANNLTTFLPINPLFLNEWYGSNAHWSVRPTVANWCCMLSKVHECLMTRMSLGGMKWNSMYNTTGIHLPLPLLYLPLKKFRQCIIFSFFLKIGLSILLIYEWWQIFNLWLI